MIYEEVLLLYLSIIVKNSYQSGKAENKIFRNNLLFNA